MTAAPTGDPGLRVGVSACLLGEKTRYDGEGRQDHWITDTLAGQVTLVSVCPEVEVGMGVPRETVRLDGDPKAPRMVATESGVDWTVRMNRYAKKRVRELSADDLCGYIFKAKSPSCGVARVKILDHRGRVRRIGRGLFAAAFARHFPLVPVEDEGRLQDPRLRENFLVRIFAWRRLQQVFAGRWRRRDLVAFHGREEDLLVAHNPRSWHELDQLVVGIADHTPAVFRDRYREIFMAGLGHPAISGPD